MNSMVFSDGTGFSRLSHSTKFSPLFSHLEKTFKKLICIYDFLCMKHHFTCMFIVCLKSNCNGKSKMVRFPNWLHEAAGHETKLQVPEWRQVAGSGSKSSQS